MGRVFCLLALLQLLFWGAALPAQEVSAKTGVEAALDPIEQGDLQKATEQAHLLLEQTPDSGTTQALLGTLWLYTGEPKRARAAFEKMLATPSLKSLALYGMGLCLLREGEMAKARANLEFSERSGGKSAVIGIVRNYLNTLEAKPLSLPKGELSPEALTASLTLRGMEALARKDTAGLDTLKQALKAPDNTLLRQSWGVLMTFDRARPLVTGYRPLANPELLEIAGNDAEPLQGEVTLSPGDAGAGVAYVMYEIDGRSIGLVSSRPYTLVWRSNEVTNGSHSLLTTLFNASGAEIRKTARRIRVVNPEPEPATEQERAKREALSNRFWNLLTLQPDRCLCGFALAEALWQKGKREEARKWYWRSIAIRPDTDAIRQRVLEREGLRQSNPAMYGGATGEKYVALTFDDGPKAGMTEPLLELLTEAKAPSTFFVIGRHVTANPELTRKIAEAGMEIANHSYTHRNLARLAKEDAEREIVETQAAVFLATGKLPHFLRPPGGNWSRGVESSVQRWGLTPGFWTVDVYGSEVLSAQEVVKSVLEQVRPGAVVLMHNGRVNTLQALPSILKELKQRGYTFVTMETLEKRLQQVRKEEQESIRNAGERKRRASE